AMGGGELRLEGDRLPVAGQRGGRLALFQQRIALVVQGLRRARRPHDGPRWHGLTALRCNDRQEMAGNRIVTIALDDPAVVNLGLPQAARAVMRGWSRPRRGP